MNINLINEGFKKEVEVIGLVALVKNSSQIKTEKELGLNLYIPKEDIIEESAIYFKTNQNGVDKGFTPKILVNLLTNYINKGLLHKFNFNDEGEFEVLTSKLTSKVTYRSSRRYLIIKVDNEIYITNCNQINQFTRHYKANYEKNKTGLQWQNLCKNLKYNNYKHIANSKMKELKIS